MKIDAPMKINGLHPHEMNGVAMRHAAQARNGAAATHVAAVPVPKPAATTPVATPASTAAPAPVESTVDMAARKLPPGLVRVAARFGAMGSEGRSGGQSNALEQVTRNLQRYVETQGLATPPASLPELPAVPPAEFNSSPDTVAPMVTPLDGPLEPIGAAADASVELAGTVQV